MNTRLTRFAVPAALGAVCAGAQAPFNMPVLLLVGLAAFVVLLEKFKPDLRQAALLGWSFGFGYFLVCLHWIASPFLVDAARHGWMAPFAVVLMAAGGGVFWMIAFWTARRLGPQAAWLIVTLPAIEMVRAYIFTGFPWATFAQSVIDTLMGQALAWGGPHGVNLVLVAGAVGIGQALLRWRRAGAIVAAALALPLLLPVIAPEPVARGQVVRLVQPNAPQDEKWDPLMIPIFYNRQLAFTAAPPTEGMAAPDLVVWPETAIPWNLTHSETILQEVSAAASGKPVVLGAQRSDGMRHFNSLVVLGPQGTVQQTYDKHHLVPFGEYVPLGDFAARFGIYGLAPQQGAGFSAGAGAQLLDLGVLGTALPLICYEAVFAHDVNAAPMRPEFIIHATNDAWFGTHAGPQQHLAQARMRAIEQGLPVARAANTGISVMIDPWGRLGDSLGLGEAGFIDAPLWAPRAPTLYSRTGDVPLALLLAAVLLIGALRVAARQRTQPE